MRNTMHFLAVRWCIINQLLSMFHLARPELRQPGYGYLLLWEEMTKRSTHYRLRNGHSMHCRNFIRNHARLRYNAFYRSHEARGDISLRSASGSPLKILGYIGFVLTFSNKPFPVEAMVSPHLGPDAMLIDNRIIRTLGGKLDWAAERLSSKDSNIIIPAIHTKKPMRSQYCSVITQYTDSDIPVFACNKYMILAAHEALIHVFSMARYVSVGLTNNCIHGHY